MAEHIKPYDEQREKKVQVEEMFDNISSKYDLLNRVLSLGIDISWRKKVIKKLKKNPPAHILDVATGTGDLAIMMAKSFPQSKVIGLDLSEGMLQQGRVKISKGKLNNQIEMVKGDSENLPFDQDRFDAITVAFGVRNFQNLKAGLKDMSRVLKPGGKLMILEFSKPKNVFFKMIYYFYFKNILPFVGKLISKDSAAYTYLPESVDAFPHGEEMENIILDCDYSKVVTKTLTFGISSIYECTK